LFFISVTVSDDHHDIQYIRTVSIGVKDIIGCFPQAIWGVSGSTNVLDILDGTNCILRTAVSQEIKLNSGIVTVNHSTHTCSTWSNIKPLDNFGYKLKKDVPVSLVSFLDTSRGVNDKNEIQ